MNRELLEALDVLEEQKKIVKENAILAIEDALKTSYKKTYGATSDVIVNLDRETGEISIFLRRLVVDEVEDDKCQIHISEAQEIDERFLEGDYVEYQVSPEDFGRIAVQRAKQIIIQRIRESEREILFEEYVNKKGQIVTAKVQRIDEKNGTIFLNLGRTEGILSKADQSPRDNIRIKDRIKVYISNVIKPDDGFDGSIGDDAQNSDPRLRGDRKKRERDIKIFVSRTHPGLVKGLFQFEVPEIEDGVVEIVKVVRSAGSRTKMAVMSKDENVDPIGSCIGTSGNRVRRVIEELAGEKIDIIEWSDDPATLIVNSLSPSKVVDIFLSYEEKSARVIVPESQLSIAIGKKGENARLASNLTEWKIDIKSSSEVEDFSEDKPAELQSLDNTTNEESVLEAQESDSVVQEDDSVTKEGNLVVQVDDNTAE